MGCHGVSWGAVGHSWEEAQGLFYGITDLFRGLKNQSAGMCQYVPVIAGQHRSRVAHPAPGVVMPLNNERACPENRKELGTGLSSFWQSIVHRRIVNDVRTLP